MTLIIFETNCYLINDELPNCSKNKCKMSSSFKFKSDPVPNSKFCENCPLQRKQIFQSLTPWGLGFPICEIVSIILESMILKEFQQNIMHYG